MLLIDPAWGVTSARHETAPLPYVLREFRNQPIRAGAYLTNFASLDSLVPTLLREMSGHCDIRQLTDARPSRIVEEVGRWVATGTIQVAQSLRGPVRLIFQGGAPKVRDLGQGVRFVGHPMAEAFLKQCLRDPAAQTAVNAALAVQTVGGEQAPADPDALASFLASQVTVRRLGLFPVGADLNVLRLAWIDNNTATPADVPPPPPPPPRPRPVPPPPPVPPPAPPVPPPQPPPPGNLEVTVLDAKTNKPIAGADVKVTGPEPHEGKTDASGKVTFSGIATGGYTATATAPHYADIGAGHGSATVEPAKTAKIELKLTPITVTIALDQPVACPGHPLGIKATGDPPGGTYAWTIAVPAADLVDGARAPIRAGDRVNLLGFKADDTTGNIPEQTASIDVTYTWTNGETATAHADVKIHEIKFVTTNNGISQSPTTATDNASQVSISFGAAATMSTNPRIEIDLDASCPRKAACAQNHQVGWLQTALTFVADRRYTHTLIHKTPALPVRDALAGVTRPFYSNPTPFTADRNKQTAHHEDSPGTNAGLTDPRPGAPAPPPAVNQQLRQIVRSESFTAWLVVQNIEWATHDMEHSFAFLGNFDWSMAMTVAVDMTQPVGSRVTPTTSNPTVPATISTGKGGGTPNLLAPIANDTTNDPAIIHIDPAPGI
jgi:hypothetical protein